MAKKFDASMFAKIKDSLAKQPTSNGSFVNILKFPAGKTYTIRLIPNLEAPDDTFFAHQVHQWKSLSNGSFISALSLQTFGEQDPIANLRWKLYKQWKDSGPAKDEKYDGVIQSKQQWFVNVYVIDDPENPENNGTVKILKMGPQLKEIIDIALTGNRSDEFGPSIFDLSKDGADFKIVAEKQGEFTTFKNSFFTSKTKFDLSDEDVDAIYEQVHDLKAIIPVKTEEELRILLNDHYFVGDGQVEAVKEERKPVAVAKKPTSRPKPVMPAAEPEIDPDFDVDDDIPMFDSPSEGDVQASIDDLIAGL